LSQLSTVVEISLHQTTRTPLFVVLFILWLEAGEDSEDFRARVLVNPDCSKGLVAKVSISPRATFRPTW